MRSRIKKIYRDKTTNRLITPQEAEARDPETYTVEDFIRPDTQDLDDSNEEETEDERLVVEVA